MGLVYLSVVLKVEVELIHTVTHPFWTGLYSCCTRIAYSVWFHLSLVPMASHPNACRLICFRHSLVLWRYLYSKHGNLKLLVLLLLESMISTVKTNEKPKLQHVIFISSLHRHSCDKQLNSHNEVGSLKNCNYIYIYYISLPPQISQVPVAYPPYI